MPTGFDQHSAHVFNGWGSDKVVPQPFDRIHEFKELLYESGAINLKYVLHISKDEQKEQLG